MPAQKKRKQTKKKSAAGKTALYSFLTIAALITLLLIVMYVNARTVHVRYTTVRLRDLPESFNGVRILFVTDVDMLGTNTAGSATALMDRLQALHPDMLLLGGDYASPSLFERLNSGDGQAGSALERQINARSAWIHSLAAYNAPMGKYAVAGEADLVPESLRVAMEAAGVNLLEDEYVVLSRGNDRIGLVGLRETGTEMRNLSPIAGKVHPEDCVLVLAHNPAAFVNIQTAEAEGGGSWADLVLSGHTHGGQINLLGRSALTLQEYEQKYLSGWRREGETVLLTSNGVGCTGANLRLNAPAEVHLITLIRGEPPSEGAGEFNPPNGESHWSP